MTSAYPHLRFDAMIYKKKCDELNQTQQSIEGLSIWLIHHRKYADLIVKIWYTEFLKATNPKKLTFIYLANDIVQNSRKKEPSLGKAFIPYLKKAFEDMGQIKEVKTKESLLRILNIWKERGTFESILIEELQESYLKGYLSQEDDEGDVDSLIKGITTPPPPVDIASGLIGHDDDIVTPNLRVRDKTNRKLNDEKAPKSGESSSRKRNSRKSNPNPEGAGTGTQQIKLAPPRSTDAPEEHDLISLLKIMWHMPSTDADTRERIARLPNEVADPSGVEAICTDSDASRQFATKVNSAQELLTDYDGKLSKELVDRKRFTNKLQSFHATQKDLLAQSEQRLQEHRRHEALLRKRLEELKEHVENMPDIKKATEEGSLKPLPSAGELFLQKSDTS